MTVTSSILVFLVNIVRDNLQALSMLNPIANTCIYLHLGVQSILVVAVRTYNGFNGFTNSKKVSSS